jgi:hypothetical protein
MERRRQWEQRLDRLGAILGEPIDHEDGPPA